MSPFSLNEIIDHALQEDMPQGDLTTESLKIENKPGIAKLLAKEDIILSGREIFDAVILKLEPNTKIKWYFDNSCFVLKGQQICMIQGNLIQLLKAERVALNFLGHLSGIASLTHCFVSQIKHTKTKILDTRKTTPLFRDLEKKAVLHGGGVNHRLNLSEAIMIKDNHIRAAGSISNAIASVRKSTKKPITIETTNLEEVSECVKFNVERVLLDNMSNEMMTDALKIIPSHIETEASGNMKIERVKSVAELGVDFISVGLITHSAPCADISLDFDWS